MRAAGSGVFLMLISTALLGPPAALAQPSTASLRGVASAPDGARLPGVVILLRHEGSGDTTETVSGEAGLFSLPRLPPGTYELVATLGGFEPHRLTVVLAPGASVSLDIRLEVATLRESVSVVGESRRDTVEAIEIRESRARDVGEALAELAGMTRVRKGAIANDVVMRGFHGKDVTVLIDGQRIDGACPGQMDPPAFHVDFAEVTRVELSRGPFDVKNQGGLAGIVNVVTERPQRGLHGEANLTLASASSLAGSVLGSFGRPRWSGLGGISMRHADPYRDGDGARITDAAGYRTGSLDGVRAYDVWTGWGRLAVVPSEGATLQLSYTRQSADEILYPYLQMDTLWDRADRAGARFETSKLPGGWQTLTAHAYYTRVAHWMTDELRTTAAGMRRGYAMATEAKTETLGGRGEVTRGGFTAGVEVSRRRWNADTSFAMRGYAPQAAMPDVIIDVAGAFATYSADAGRHWRLEGGARIDAAESAADGGLANTALYAAYHGTRQTSASDTLPAGYVRARWRRGGVSAVAGAGRSSRLPDQQERFYALQRMGADWVGNPRLSPSRNTGFDGELRYLRGGAELTLAAYAYRVDDAIRVYEQARVAMVPGVMNARARSYLNVDALTRGFEAGATVPLTVSLRLSADASYVRGTIRGSSPLSRDLPEMPAPRLRVRLRWDRARWNAAAEAVGAAKQARVATDLQEAPTPAWTILNVRAGWRLKGLTVLAAIDNLFDTRYAEHLSYQRDPFRSGVRVYEPGRTATLSVAVRR